MSPTIRIDDEVYDWLQAQAVPFDDTPNSVLRRVAGLDKAGHQSSSGTLKKGSRSPRRSKGGSGRRQPLARGDELILRWGINARQARFHRDGTFYERPTRFPAALCDPNGYVVFETEQEYRNCQHLILGRKLNVHGGISSIPGYQKVDDPITR